MRWSTKCPFIVSATKQNKLHVDRDNGLKILCGDVFAVTEITTVVLGFRPKCIAKQILLNSFNICSKSTLKGSRWCNTTNHASREWCNFLQACFQKNTRNVNHTVRCRIFFITQSGAVLNWKAHSSPLGVVTPMAARLLSLVIGVLSNRMHLLFYILLCLWTFVKTHRALFC